MLRIETVYQPRQEQMLRQNTGDEGFHFLLIILFSRVKKYLETNKLRRNLDEQNGPKNWMEEQ